LVLQISVVIHPAPRAEDLLLFFSCHPLPQAEDLFLFSLLLLRLPFLNPRNNPVILSEVAHSTL
jgi:hypothetical protein